MANGWDLWVWLECTGVVNGVNGVVRRHNYIISS